ncbi:MAG: hypothetical protein BEU05_02565 [Marine Group III euryarchaeote CG-Bathy2]|uniref:Peptidase M28 domain-containing protein n=2 Tax=Methanobacteriati TaxID=3366610 RepID=A0A075GPE1_9EURY|nr:hypothetical protein [uncultured marine group II/III euryarchaeote KM3_188_A01]OIR09625.1 MAG: hypothetical protein BEU05_02565 [Marine Group III euryarchaeote CG-Bathy2]
MNPKGNPTAPCFTPSLALLLLLPAFAGCLDSGEPAQPSLAASVEMAPDELVGGAFQPVEFTARQPLSLLVPYPVRDSITGLVQNGTVLDFAQTWDSWQVEMLAPPGHTNATFLVAELGRDAWPLRATNESWREWIDRGGPVAGMDDGIGALRVAGDGELPPLVPARVTAAGVEAVQFPVVRPPRDGIAPEQGGGHSTGLIDGYSIYEWLEIVTDEQNGYNERWGPLVPRDPVYERALEFLENEFDALGLDGQIHHYELSSSPWAANVCGYRTGSVYPDEWVVLGAHLDIAEPGSPPGGGTHIGAHDNTAGVAMALAAAGALAQFDSRRTLAVCFWSNEENGYDGADRWIDNLPAGVTVTNYLNIDSAGVNYPGEYTLVVDIIPDSDDLLNEQWEMISLTEWIGSTFYDIAPVLRNGRELYYTEGYAAMKDHDHPHPDTISVHESQRGRSDYVRFADRLGVVSLDFGAITGGYDCYHAPCDTLPEMVDWMATVNATGQQNLVASLDMIAWWFAGLFWYLDERPVYDRS